METPNYFLPFLPNYSGSNLESEFRFYDWKPTGGINAVTGFDTTQTEQLQTAKNNALVSGDSFTVKLLENILKFGVPALTALSQAGVIKNKNITSLAQISADRTALDILLAQTGGNLDPDSVYKATGKPDAEPRQTETKILGVPVTYIIVGGIGFILYMLFNDKKTSKTK